MIYMLDTDICGHVMREHAQSVLETLHARSVEGHGVCISVITHQELRFGAERAGSAKHHNRIDSFRERIDFIADWGVEQADKFARIQTALLTKGKPIGFADTMIASHALTLDATLVTNNTRHFSEVDELRHESWTGAGMTPTAP